MDPTPGAQLPQTIVPQGLIPHTWDGWGGVFAIFSGLVTFGAWFVHRIDQRGYQRGRREERKLHEAAALQGFQQSMAAEMEALRRQLAELGNMQERRPDEEG
jgi:hypothetical protein